MRYKNTDHVLGENSEYFVLDPPKLILKEFKIGGLMFTRKELDMAHRRWQKKGRPKKESFLGGLFGW